MYSVMNAEHHMAHQERGWYRESRPETPRILGWRAGTPARELRFQSMFLPHQQSIICSMG